MPRGTTTTGQKHPKKGQQRQKRRHSSWKQLASCLEASLPRRRVPTRPPQRDSPPARRLPVCSICGCLHSSGVLCDGVIRTDSCSRFLYDVCTWDTLIMPRIARDVNIWDADPDVHTKKFLSREWYGSIPIWS